jgi:hypothetical protein
MFFFSFSQDPIAKNKIFFKWYRVGCDWKEEEEEIKTGLLSNVLRLHRESDDSNRKKIKNKKINECSTNS